MFITKNTLIVWTTTKWLPIIFVSLIPVNWIRFGDTVEQHVRWIPVKLRGEKPLNDVASYHRLVFIFVKDANYVATSSNWLENNCLVQTQDATAIMRNIIHNYAMKWNTDEWPIHTATKSNRSTFNFHSTCLVVYAPHKHLNTLCLCSFHIIVILVIVLNQHRSFVQCKYPFPSLHAKRSISTYLKTGFPLSLALISSSTVVYLLLFQRNRIGINVHQREKPICKSPCRLSHQRCLNVSYKNRMLHHVRQHILIDRDQLKKSSSFKVNSNSILKW